MLQFEKNATTEVSTTIVDESDDGTAKAVDPVQKAGYLADMISLLIEESPIQPDAA